MTIMYFGVLYYTILFCGLVLFTKSSFLFRISFILKFFSNKVHFSFRSIFTFKSFLISLFFILLLFLFIYLFVYLGSYSFSPWLLHPNVLLTLRPWMLMCSLRTETPTSLFTRNYPLSLRQYYYEGVILLTVVNPESPIVAFAMWKVVV